MTTSSQQSAAESNNRCHCSCSSRQKDDRRMNSAAQAYRRSCWQSASSLGPCSPLDALPEPLEPRRAMISVPVLIVGGGPVGPFASILLSRLGIALRLVERRAGTALHPEARNINMRTMENLPQERRR